MIDGFVLPANRGGTSPDAIDRKRRMAEAMLGQGMSGEPVQHWSQGLNKIAQALVGGYAMRKADREESEGRKGAQDALLRALSGGKTVHQGDDPQDSLVEAMNNPFMSPQGSAMAMDMWKRQNEQPDPMKQLQMQKLQAEIDKMNNPQANSEAGLNLVYWKDAQGNLHAGQPLKGGGMKEVPLPEGGQWAPGVGYLDTGTDFVPYDKRGGVMGAQPIPKDLAGAEAQKEIGTASGKATAAAPADMAAAETALTLLDSIEKDPNLDMGVGGTSMWNFIPGSSGRDFQTKVDQATSGAFLSAIQQMRGMGALSNAEGQTATQAVTRMTTSASKEEFMSALNDYRTIVQAGYSRAASRMGAGDVQAPPVQGGPKRLRFNPATGELE